MGLPVRGADVGFWGLTGAFTLGLTFGQKLGQAQQAVQVFGLPGDHIRQVFDGAGQMRDAFFKGFGAVHLRPLLAADAPIRYTEREKKRRL